MKTELNPILPAAAVTPVAAAPPRAAPAAAPVAAPPAPVDARALATAVAEAARQLAEKGAELTIEFDDTLQRTVFRLIDHSTGEVVRQVPSEEALAVARALAEAAGPGTVLRTDA